MLKPAALPVMRSLTGTVSLQHRDTLYDRFGNWFGIINAVIAVFMIVGAIRRKKITTVFSLIAVVIDCCSLVGQEHCFEPGASTNLISVASHTCTQETCIAGVWRNTWFN